MYLYPIYLLNCPIPPGALQVVTFLTIFSLNLVEIKIWAEAINNKDHMKSYQLSKTNEENTRK